MRNSNKYLIVLVLLLTIVSYVVLQDENKEVVTNTLLVPELQDKVNDVNTVTINQGQQTLNFYKQDGLWRIKEYDSFFADANKVAEMLLSLREFRLKQPKTSNQKNYHKLGLADAQAINIVLKSNEKVFADIYIGKESLKVQGTYVRKKSDDLTWLASGKLSINLDKRDWIFSNIIDIPSSAVKSVAYQVVNEKGFKIEKTAPTDEKFLLENLPENKQLKENVDLKTLANGLLKFTIDDVIKNITLSEASLVNSLSYELFSGVVYRLNLYIQEDKNYVKIILENADSLTTVQKQLNQWVFTVPQFKFDAFNKNLESILEDISKKPQEKSN